MSGSLRRLGAFFFLATTGVMLSPGCATNESSLFIRQCQLVPPTTCEVKADSTAVFLFSGTLDTSFGTLDKNNTLVPNAYSCPLLVGNQLVERGDPDRLRTETSRIEVYGADITVTDNSEAVLTRSDGSAAKFFTWTSGFVDPGTGTAPGFGLAQVEMIDPALALDLRREVEKTGFEQEVVAHVVLHGRTLGGSELTSAPWTFPIRVCKGCLCDLAPCLGSTSDMPAANCRPGLDSTVDCRLGFSSCR